MPPITRRGKTPRARPLGKGAPRRFSSVAGAPGGDSRLDRISDCPRVAAHRYGLRTADGRERINNGPPEGGPYDRLLSIELSFEERVGQFGIRQIGRAH